MKTNPKLIKLLKMTCTTVRVFEPSDWDAFAGCESEDPWMGFTDTGEQWLLIADGDTLELHYGCFDEQDPIRLKVV